MATPEATPGPAAPAPEIRCAVAEPAQLGESPFWHPDEQCLYHVDIPGRELRRFDPSSGRLDRWPFDDDVACCAPVMGGGVLLGRRSGFWHFEPGSGACRRIGKAPPYDPARERFNDGKADPAGRMWCGTLYEPRQPPNAALYRLREGEIERVADGITVSNGLGWSPDGRTMYWSDTTSHTIFVLDFDLGPGTPSNRRVFARFATRAPGAPLDGYGGRPDGAAVDAEGGLWVAMFEGQRLLRLDPTGRIEREIALPVRCPTMPCFGGPDLRTLYVTTARHHRSEAELAAQPWAGCVLAMRVEVPGLPVNFVHLD